MPDPVYPLGLACLGGSLRRAGYHTIWLDCLAQDDPLEAVLAANEPDFVGLSLRNIDDVLIRKQETYFGELTALVARVRQWRPCPVILGGSGFSIFPRQLLASSGADFGICGDGEASLVSLLEALQQGGDLTAIPGLVHRQEGEIVINGVSRPPLAAALGEADRPVATVRHYLETGGMLNLQTQRGCAFRCCYCTYPVIEGRRPRRFPPELVAEDFARLAGLGARYAFIVDSVFNSSAEHVVGVCEAILRRGVAIAWGCFLRPQGLTRDLMRLMVRAGLAHIEFGSDSFCDAVLTTYEKGFGFEDILAASELARRENVGFCHFLIAGGPGETSETLAQGFANSEQLPEAVILAVTGMRIYPGTALFERAVAEGRIGRDQNLLAPTYYLSPGLTADGVFAQLQEFARQSANWIVGDPDPGYRRLVERLRQRGAVGPLWSYFSMLQRLWPRNLAFPAAQ